MTLGWNTMRKQICLLFASCVALTAGALHAQDKAEQRNASVALVPDEENLNVFQQWIRWNNAGSLLLNHLIRQATSQYEVRTGR